MCSSDLHENFAKTNAPAYFAPVTNIESVVIKWWKKKLFTLLLMSWQNKLECFFLTRFLSKYGFNRTLSHWMVTKNIRLVYKTCQEKNTSLFWRQTDRQTDRRIYGGFWLRIRGKIRSYSFICSARFFILISQEWNELALSLNDRCFSMKQLPNCQWRLKKLYSIS